MLLPRTILPPPIPVYNTHHPYPTKPLLSYKNSLSSVYVPYTTVKGSSNTTSSQLFYGNKVYVVYKPIYILCFNLFNFFVL